MSDAKIIHAASLTLDAVIAADRPDLAGLSDERKCWLLGQVWEESRFGSTPDWGTSNNWGAVTYHKGDGKFIEHKDHDSQGHPVVYRFQAYDTQLDAARDWLRVLLRGDVPKALRDGSAHDLAAAMYHNGYYTGMTGTPEDRIIAYTSFILQGAAFVKARLSGDEPAHTLRRGATGEDVSSWQAVLNAGPVPTAWVDVHGKTKTWPDTWAWPLKVDGDFGERTEMATESWQFQHKLAADGVVGPLTQTEAKTYQ